MGKETSLERNTLVFQGFPGPQNSYGLPKFFATWPQFFYDYIVPYLWLIPVGRCVGMGPRTPEGCYFTVIQSESII